MESFTTIGHSLDHGLTGDVPIGGAHYGYGKQMKG